MNNQSQSEHDRNSPRHVGLFVACLTALLVLIGFVGFRGGWLALASEDRPVGNLRPADLIPLATQTSDTTNPNAATSASSTGASTTTSTTIATALSTTSTVAQPIPSTPISTMLSPPTVVTVLPASTDVPAGTNGVPTTDEHHDDDHHDDDQRRDDDDDD
jgi:hypothetical protein